MKERHVSILLIEDSPEYAYLVGEYLRRAAAAPVPILSATLEHYDNLPDGLDRMKLGGIDLVLLDLYLRDSSGLETFLPFKPYAAHTPVIVLTGLKDHSLGLELLNAGALDYLVKEHANQWTLIQAIRHALGRHRVQAEMNHYLQAFRESERRFRQIISQNADGILVIDQSNAIQFANKAASDLFKLSLDALIGQTLETPLPLDAPADIELILQGEVYAVAEMRVVETEWDMKPAYLASLREVTERKKTEQRMKQHATHQSSLFHALPDNILELDHKGTIITHKYDLRLPLLASSDSAVGKKLDDVFFASTARLFRERLTEVLQANEPRVFQHPFRVGEGTRHFETRMVPLTDRRVLAISRDAEEEWQQEEEVAQVFTLIAHSLTDLEQRVAHLRQSSPQEPHTYLLATMDRLRLLAESYRSPRATLPEDIEVITEAHGVIQLMTPLAEEKNLTLKVVAPSGGMDAHINPTLLRRLMVYLLDLAIDTAQEHQVTLRIEQEEQDLCLSVSAPPSVTGDGLSLPSGEGHVLSAVTRQLDHALIKRLVKLFEGSQELTPTDSPTSLRVRIPEVCTPVTIYT